VHIHTAVGIGDYFQPLAKQHHESRKRAARSALRSTTFVMIHGGYPLEREAIWLAAMKNVYLDSSFGEMAQYPAAFKDTLKMWLETFPDKITFGTDCFPYNQVLGTEESYWLGVQSRRAPPWLRL
jgi:predicted TIM-barrel fold metal-dependent hydrolase